MKKRLKLEPNNNNLIIWEAEQPKAVLQLVHGMVEYVERYEEFALAMNKEGFTVIGHDHLGHGYTAQNQSQLGVFPESPEELIDDIERVTSFIQESYPELPIVLLGHSMGSLMCRYYVAKRKPPTNALIIMATGQQPQFLTRFALILTECIRLIKGNKHRSKLLTYLSTDSFNRSIKNPKTSVDWLSKNEESNLAYLKDPFCQFIPTISMYRSIFYFSNQVASKQVIDEIPAQLPILVISGQEDPLGENGKGIERFVKLLKASHSKVSVRVVEEARHEILNEINRQDTYHFLADWMTKNMDV